MPEEKELKPFLIIEDNKEDFELTVRAFRKSGFAHPFHHCTDGEDALDYLLHRCAPYQTEHEAPRPELIFLDLHMPGMDGHEVLDRIKSDPDLQDIPVLIITDSEDDQDLRESYRRGADSYIQKPITFEKFINAMERLRKWFGVVILPNGEEQGNG